MSVLALLSFRTGNRLYKVQSAFPVSIPRSFCQGVATSVLALLSFRTGNRLYEVQSDFRHAALTRFMC